MHNWVSVSRFILAKLVVVYGILGLGSMAQAQTYPDPNKAASMSSSQAPKQVQLTICREVDDNWQPIDASDVWKAGKPFNVLIVSPTPFRMDFLGIVIHKQGPDGKDVEFVSEYQQRIDDSEQSRKYATTEGLPPLSPGKYSIYVINWRKRQVSEHSGNFTDHLAKVTLTVK